MPKSVSPIIFTLGGRFGYFLFFFGRGEGRGSPRRWGGGGFDFLLKIPGGGGSSRGGSEGPGGCCGELGNLGGGLNIFFSGPKCPPSTGLHPQFQTRFQTLFPIFHQGQVSTEGILHLVNPNSGSNSGMRIFEPRILGPSSRVEFFGPMFSKKKSPLKKFTAQNSHQKIHPKIRAEKFTLHSCRAIVLNFHNETMQAWPC